MILTHRTQVFDDILIYIVSGIHIIIFICIYIYIYIFVYVTRWTNVSSHISARACLHKLISVSVLTAESTNKLLVLHRIVEEVVLSMSRSNT